MQDRANVRIMPPVILIAALGLGLVVRAEFGAKILPSELAIAIGFLTIAASIFFVCAPKIEAKCEIRRVGL